MESVLCHTVTNNIFELVTLISNSIGEIGSLIFGKPLTMCACPNKQLSFPTMEFRREGKKSFVVTPTFHVISNISGTKKHANTVAISCDY